MVYLCPNQIINIQVQIWSCATRIVHRNFPRTMAWLNLKHVGSLIIHDMMTCLCLWVIEQLVTMMCTLYNTNLFYLLASNCQGLFFRQGF
jgi:hypothetical protein